MAKRQLPQPKRSEFDKTELLQRLADLEARVERLENRTIFGSSNLIGSGVRI